MRHRSKPAAGNSRIAAKAAPTGSAPDPWPAPGFCGRGLPTPTRPASKPADGRGRVAAKAAPTRSAPGSWSVPGSVGGIFRPRHGLHRSLRTAEALSRPRPLPQEVRPARGLRRVLWEGSSDPDTACIEACGQQRPCRDQGRSHRECARSWPAQGSVGGVFRPRLRRISKPADGRGRVAAKAAPTGSAADPWPAPGFCGRGLLTPTRPASKPADGRGPVAAKAAPTGDAPNSWPAPGFCGRGLPTPTAADIEACGRQRPCRGQGRSHRECGRSLAGAGLLWEGSSDPDTACIEACGRQRLLPQEASRCPVCPYNSGLEHIR